MPALRIARLPGPERHAEDDSAHTDKPLEQQAGPESVRQNGHVVEAPCGFPDVANSSTPVRNDFELWAISGDRFVDRLESETRVGKQVRIADCMIRLDFVLRSFEITSGSMIIAPNDHFREFPTLASFCSVAPILRRLA